ncbi:kynurenine 3-monooxygenase, mitochondrial precursor [Tieghemiomyces parasiticus]|uniref:Kynurenine 3-monooxygenase, mitochondrial n=1 Tax=Tieghemiomyces parasiticus TaxID=78921 RepID=A0A9W8A3S6_9FUNG|nr:kynurenine 3-monooxygenase, mitochondrial precursor [Tieghemiomyces parasiticus]
MRLPENRADLQQRSINLALSVRGLSALQGAGLNLDQEMLDIAIPMKGRMIHDFAGNQTSQLYSVFGKTINSVDRALLNAKLLTAAEQFSNLKIFFNHALKTCDLDVPSATFLDKTTGQEVTDYADLIVGADGAYSTCRRQLMRKARINFAQEYIDHGYCELTIPARRGADGQPEYQMSPYHLHIWPRHTFMLIALPNPDKTFTCTLFMPYDQFEQLQTEAHLLSFFSQYFPNAIPLIGRDQLVKQYFTNEKGTLLSVKCSPYHYQDRLVIIGDAAHCMVPFYGQGMNCGFEDVEVLAGILDRHTALGAASNVGAALAEYSAVRHRDAVAICELAMRNYIEMRSSVSDWRYLLRKRIEDRLHHWFPRTVIPLYTMVSFTKIPYHLTIAQHDRQTRWLNRGMLLSATLALIGIYSALRRLK